MKQLTDSSGAIDYRPIRRDETRLSRGENRDNVLWSVQRYRRGSKHLLTRFELRTLVKRHK